jgi:hypothetical protein
VQVDARGIAGVQRIIVFADLNPLQKAVEFVPHAAEAFIALRIKRPDATRPFRVPFYPLTPILFVLAGAVIVLNTVYTQPRDSAIGIAVVLAGAPAYLIWKRRLAAAARS